MVSKAAVIRQTVLLSISISVFPLILYPSMLGIREFSLHPLYAFAEWALYFLIYLGVLSTRSVWQKFVAGGTTVLFRLAIGSVLGLLVTLMHGTPPVTAVSFCLWQYPPAFILHIIFVPFLLRPIYDRVWARGMHFAIDSGRPSTPLRSVGFSFSRPLQSVSSVRRHAEVGELSFDAATAWIGEHSGIRMSLVVDEDGLVVSHWERQAYSRDAEFWAAIGLEMTRFHRRWPTVETPVDLRCVEVETDSGRLIIRRAGPFWLMILAEADAELVSVRLVQAIGMVEKHYHDRYRTVHPAGLEVSYV